MDCGMDLPADSEHFKADKDGALGPRCLPCHRAKRQEYKKNEKQKTMNDVEHEAMTSFLRQTSSGGENIPHSSEVLERVMLYLGGVNGFAGCLVKQMFDSPPGSATRTKMLEAVLRLIVKNTEMGGAKKPLEQWSDAELEDELDNRLKRIAAQFGGVIVNGSLAEEGASADTNSFLGINGGISGSSTEGDTGGTVEQEHRSPEAVPSNKRSRKDSRKQSK
jgi:hypothetical protein